MEVMGLPLLIEWDKFQVGTSIFVPCIDRKPVEKFITQETRRLRLNVVCKQVVEKGVYGLRVWRVDDIVHPHSSPSPVGKLSPT
jgi:hypothetical protein